jgi:hypothetical protein
MTKTLRPGVVRLMAQEGEYKPSSPIREIQDKLDAALSNGHDAEDGVLALPGVVTETSLTLPPGLAFEQWQQVGFTLKRINRAWRWWVGDWIAYGERAYGEMYSQAIEETGIGYGQLAQIVHVAKRVEPDMRREGLSWSTHASVARLERDAAIAVLDKAETEGLSRQEVRSAVKAITDNQNIPHAETLSSTCLCHCHTGKCVDCGMKS